MYSVADKNKKNENEEIKKKSKKIGERTVGGKAMNTERFLLSEKENVVVIIIAGNLLIYTGYNVVVVNGGEISLRS